MAHVETLSKQGLVGVALNEHSPAQSEEAGKATSPLASQRGPRLVAVDAIRGLAAFAVVLFHVPGGLYEAAGIPEWLRAVFAKGYLGVDAFFVLSGFVISLSVAGSTWNVSYLLRFIARRSVRLDPSYWAAIAVELSLGYIGMRFLHDQYSLPTIPAVLAHVGYVQGFFGFENISDVFWTLCFEIQFYFGLVGLLVVTNGAWLKQYVSQRVVLGAVLIVVTLLSVAVRGGHIPNPQEGLALIRAYQFSLGAVTLLYAKGQVRGATAAALVGGVLCVRLLDGAILEVAVTATACALCLGSIKSATVNKMADVKAIQFLGKISYSLYLYHASIVWRGATVSLMVAKQTGVSWLPHVGLAGCILGTILFSYVMFRLIEAPTMQLSKRIRLS